MKRHKIFTRSELNAMAREKGIKYYYDYPVHELRVKLGIEKPIVKFPKNYTKGKLRNMARDRGYNNLYFAKLNKFELAEMLGIELRNKRMDKTITDLPKSTDDCIHPTLGELDGSIFCTDCGVETDRVLQPSGRVWEKRIRR